MDFYIEVGIGKTPEGSTKTMTSHANNAHVAASTGQLGLLFYTR